MYVFGIKDEYVNNLNNPLLNKYIAIKRQLEKMVYVIKLNILQKCMEFLRL